MNMKNKSLQNYELYNDVEFKNFAGRTDLIPAEKYFIDKYLMTLGPDVPILEIGTGSGRLSFELAKLQFKNIIGIDLSEKLIEFAQEFSKKNFPDTTKFLQMDASELKFDDNSFDFAIATGQIISLIPSPEGRKKAVSEAFRVLKPGGKLLISFLNYESRPYNSFISLLSLPFKSLRDDSCYRNWQYLPYLSLGGKPNFAYLWQRQPYAFWFRQEECGQLVKSSPFNILEERSRRAILTNSSEPVLGGMYYILAEKP